MQTDEPEFKEMVNILQHVAGDEELRKELDREQYFVEAMDEMFGEKDRKLSEYKVNLEKKDRELVEKNNALSQKDRELAEIKQASIDLARALKQKV